MCWQGCCLQIQDSCVLSAVADLSALGPLLCQHNLGRMVQRQLLLGLAAAAAPVTS
jgi:hypothetical protein